MRWSVDLVARVDAARGGLSRTAWIERAVEQALGDGPLVAVSGSKESLGSASARSASAPARRSVPKKVERDLGEGTPLPKIGRRQSWL